MKELIKNKIKNAKTFSIGVCGEKGKKEVEKAMGELGYRPHQYELTFKSGDSVVIVDVFENHQ